MTTVEQRLMHDCRDSYARTLEELAESDERIVALANDSVGSSKLDGFRERFPRRLINVGIAEQDLVGIAAGLANGGRIPFVSAASCFLTGRALEQIKVDVAYSDANVKLCGMSPGVAYGQLGATHHSIEDLSWLRAIANLTVVVPADPVETAQAVTFAAETPGPVFVRVSRMPVPDVYPDDYRFEAGRAVRLRDGADVTLVANGTMVSRALDAADLLEVGGIGAMVLSVPTVAPIDVEAIVAAAEETGALVTIEEATTRGGLGGAVAEVVVEHRPVPMRLLGIPEFAPTGTTEWLLDHFGLTPAGIEASTRDFLGEIGR
jgi:transketolase